MSVRNERGISIVAGPPWGWVRRRNREWPDVLKALRHWVLEDDDSGKTPDPSAAPAERGEGEAISPEDQRLSRRHDMCGARGVIRSRRTMAFIHLKDLSCLGASGITALPVAVGAMVFLTVQKGRWHAAEVLWVKNVMMGLRFYRPLDPDLVEKVHANHLSSKAAKELDQQWKLAGL